MLRRRVGKVLRVLGERPGVVEIEVEVDSAPARAIAYPELTGPVSEGDSVLLNTIAVSLKLGTGGSHFVIANLSHPVSEEPPGPGHIMKLRYTPLQTALLAVEEEASPHRAAMEAFESLAGMPVIAGELHSQLAPACGALKRAKPGCRIAYIMTDAAALPIALSRAVTSLKERGLLDAAITCGQAFGGDLEAVTLHSALSIVPAIHARRMASTSSSARGFWSARALMCAVACLSSSSSRSRSSCSARALMAFQPVRRWAMLM